MREAKLPGGTSILFPDNTTDREMDKTVELIVNAKKGGDKRDSALVKLTSQLFGKVSGQIEGLKQALYQMPKLIAEQQFDLSKLENSSDALLTESKKANEMMRGQLDKLVTISNSAGKDDAAAARKEIRNLAGSIAGAIEASHKAMKIEVIRALAENNKALMKKMEASDDAHEQAIRISTKVIRREVIGMKEGIIEAIRAPRDLLFDKKDRPIGVKVRGE